MSISHIPALAAAAAFLASGCLPYVYHERHKVLIPGIDIDQTLDVAEAELEEASGVSVLTIWTMRDQIVTTAQAARISDIYLAHIDDVDSPETRARSFQVWHLTWAISNLYRLGSDGVKTGLEPAYIDAAARVETLDKKVALIHFSGEKIYMGDAHGGGRAYANSHLVVPGNNDYLQSYEEYLAGGEPEPQLMLYAEPTRQDAEILQSF
ncbi:MAG: hypothetical protein JRG91_04580 [Deltaproteobacteria bacterium]|nr:hypothetical protein [Deltaproteobacteria bacterium]